MSNPIRYFRAVHKLASILFVICIIITPILNMFTSMVATSWLLIVVCVEGSDYVKNVQKNFDHRQEYWRTYWRQLYYPMMLFLFSAAAWLLTSVMCVSDDTKSFLLLEGGIVNGALLAVIIGNVWFQAYGFLKVAEKQKGYFD